MEYQQKQHQRKKKQEEVNQKHLQVPRMISYSRSSSSSVCLLAVGFIAFLLVPVANTSPASPDIIAQERVVGGASATAGQFPYVVSLRASSSNSHFCGGTIHTSRYVLTAAHCMVNKVSLNVNVVAGSISLTSGGTSYAVTSVTSHPNYNAYTFLNDISVLKTSTSISFTEQVKALPISATFVGNNIHTVAVGWGMTTVLGQTSDTLQWISLTTISNTMCKSIHGTSDAEKITDASLCTYTGVGMGMCQNDSGGPLVYNNELVGIISWGVACAQGKPDVYTRISSVFSWVDTVVEV